MDFLEATYILQNLHGGVNPSFLNKLDFKLEDSEKEQIQNICSDLTELISKEKSLVLVSKALAYLKILEQFQKWVEQPMYLNEYKDRSGNKYIQARTSIKDENGKTKWVSAYVGSIKDYPKGVNDPYALEAAKPLLRKKLKKYFGLE